MKGKIKPKAKASPKTKPVSAKKKRTKKIVLTVFAVGAAGVLGYFGWQYFKRRKDKRSGRDLDEALKAGSTSVITPSTSSPYPGEASASNPKTYVYPSTPKPQSSSEFPLKKGSKGEKVRELQEALIARYGKDILPKYGADGDFGSETATALKKVGLSSTISQSAFNVLVQGSNATGSTASAGQELFSAVMARDFNKVMTVLKKMKTTSDYSTANEVFKTLRLNGGVRQTIVNGLLNTFRTTDQKEKIKFEFLRMGLQFDGDKWSLSGFDGFPIITIVPTKVWVNATNGVSVPARMVLGNAVSRRLDYTLFENKGKYFLVQTKCVKNL